MNIKHVKNLALFCSFIAVFYACSSSESTVVVVEDEPTTEQTQQPDSVDEQFTQLTIGLIDTVSNYDPLFVENLSAQRTLSLIYEGLYTLDREGDPIPAIAGNLEVSEDSLEYVFTLKEDKFFHSSPVFTAGVGRRVTASDVKMALERTAKISVPENAAQLLMNVRGFENYFLEQRTVYDSEKRVLEGVAGIQVINSQTVAIVLSEKDPDFLKILASPYLFIYPQESINNSERPLSENPVGTGPYYLNRVEQSGQIVLSRDERRNIDYQRSLINRINLMHYPNESELFQEFATGQTDWIPEIGPATSEQVLNEEGNLRSSFEDENGDNEINFNLIKNNADRIVAFYLNDRATLNHDWLINRLAYLTDEDFTTRGDVMLNVDDFEVTENAKPREQYFSSYTDDTLARTLLNELHNIIFVPESSLVLFDIRVPTKQTSIYTQNSSSLQHAMDPLNEGYWLRTDTQILGLTKNRVTGIEPTIVPWLLHIEEVRVGNSEPSVQ